MSGPSLAVLVAFTLLFLPACQDNHNRTNGLSLLRDGEVCARARFSCYYKQTTSKPIRGRILVFIHGISSDAGTAWGDPARSDFWPRLVDTDRAFSDFDIFLVNYESRGSFRNYLTIHQIAVAELDHLTDLGVFDYEQVFFVAHSMGGLVLQDMMTQLKGSRPSVIERFRRIKAAIFLATPAQGTSVAKVISWYDKQAAGMTPLHDNEALQRLQASWRSLIQERGSAGDAFPRVFCAYETAPVAVFIGLLVPQEAIPSPCDGSQHPMDRLDHVAVAKPTDRTRDPYLWTMARVREASSAAGNPENVVAIDVLRIEVDSLGGAQVLLGVHNPDATTALDVTSVQVEVVAYRYLPYWTASAKPVVPLGSIDRKILERRLSSVLDMSNIRTIGPGEMEPMRLPISPIEDAEGQHVYLLRLHFDVYKKGRLTRVTGENVLEIAQGRYLSTVTERRLADLRERAFGTLKNEDERMGRADLEIRHAQQDMYWEILGRLNDQETIGRLQAEIVNGEYDLLGRLMHFPHDEFMVDLAQPALCTAKSYSAVQIVNRSGTPAARDVLLRCFEKRDQFDKMNVFDQAVLVMSLEKFREMRVLRSLRARLAEGSGTLLLGEALVRSMEQVSGKAFLPQRHESFGELMRRILAVGLYGQVPAESPYRPVEEIESELRQGIQRTLEWWQEGGKELSDEQLASGVRPERPERP